MRQAAQRTNLALPLILVPVATVAVFLILLGLSVGGLQETSLDNGAIELADVSLDVLDDRLQLSALADISLPTTLQAGLDNGVPLTFVLQLRLYQPTRFWFDKTLQHFERRYTLTYYELTRHYRVDELNTEESRNYRSLSSALAGLGKLQKLQFALSDMQNSVFAALTLSLDTAALPLPLQPLMNSSWGLASREYQWPVI